MMRRLLIPAAVTMLVASMAFTAAPAQAVGGEGEAWPSFNESGACGASRITTPLAEKPGSFGTSTILRGPFAAFFGRTVSEVRASSVPWTIPGSGTRLNAHERIVAALDLVDESLMSALDEGAEYPIRGSSTSATASRTIAGTERMSRHTFGIAFDFNAHANPYRGDNVKVTDMPDWWVESFEHGGFCWGGAWIGSKDAMHYAWQGPAFSDYDTLPLPYEPLTEPRPLSTRAATVPVMPEALPGTFTTLLADVTTNAAADVVRLVDTPDGLLIDSSVASRGHNACSSSRGLVAGLGSLPDRALTIDFGDWDGRGGNDLWLVTDEGGRLRLTVRLTYGGYAAETSVVTGVPTPSESAWISAADWNADGSLDLFVIDGGSLRIWGLDPRSGATQELFDTSVVSEDGARFLLADSDLDNRPDLWTLSGGDVTVAFAADDYASASPMGTPVGLPSRILDASASDYDGDGRPDLIVFDGSIKHVWLANSRLPDGLPLETWFEYPDSECEDTERRWQQEDLRYFPSRWVESGAYAWRVANGFDAGCDPEDEECETPLMTHGSFVQFMAWVDGLEAASNGDAGTAAARAVASAGYPIPCALDDPGCLAQPMLLSDISSYFGQFLAIRHGSAPNPHRWIVSRQVYQPIGPS